MSGFGSFRLEPAGPPGAYQTWSIRSPIATHYRPASCAEVDCEHYRDGWRTRIEGLPPELLHTATHSGRKFSRLDVAAGETWLVFEAGQPCFAATQHRLPVGRPEIFLARRGDWRAAERARRYDRADQWVSDFGEHQQRLADRHNEG